MATRLSLAPYTVLLRLAKTYHQQLYGCGSVRDCAFLFGPHLRLLITVAQRNARRTTADFNLLVASLPGA